MIEFLSDYPSAVNLVICIIIGFCILLSIDCVRLLSYMKELLEYRKYYVR